MEANKLFQIIAEQQNEAKEFDTSCICPRYEETLMDLDSSLAQIVIGVRRCGKSTLCHTVLKNSGKKYAYINFDDERFTGLTASDLNEVLEALYIVYGDFKYLFLDEIQNVKGWDLFVNRLLRQKIKLIITGSNAKLLSSELSTYLTGRYNQIELFPFSFLEYVNTKEINNKPLTTKDVAFCKAAFNEYMIEGGFPEILNLKNSKSYIKQLINSIVTVDIRKRFRIKYIDALQKITNFLIANFAQEVNYHSLASIFGLGSGHTAENYVNYLRQTYLLVGLNKFSYKAKERIRAEKLYLIDIALLTQQDNSLTSSNLGWRLENIVYLELLRRKKIDGTDIYYFRKGYEIDFVVCKGINVVELIQVTVNLDQVKTFNRETNALIKGKTELKCSNLTLLTLGESKTHIVDDVLIREVNVMNWLLGSL